MKRVKLYYKIQRKIEKYDGRGEKKKPKNGTGASTFVWCRYVATHVTASTRHVAIHTRKSYNNNNFKYKFISRIWLFI